MHPSQLLMRALEGAYLQGVEDLMESGEPPEGGQGFEEQARAYAQLKLAEIKSAYYSLNPTATKEGDASPLDSFGMPPGLVAKVLEQLWKSFRKLDPQGLADLQGIDAEAFIEACNESQDLRIQRNLAGYRRFVSMVMPLSTAQPSEAGATS